MFPKQSQIWQGAVLGSIAHAIGVNRFPDLSHEQSWENNNYSIQNSAGSRGTIAFCDKRFVGVFFLDTSPRNALRGTDGSYGILNYFETMPRELESLARNEALQYVLQESPHGIVPLITAAFWGDGSQEYVAAAESWDEVFRHGAVLIKNQLMTHEQAMPQWIQEYELDGNESEVVSFLFNERIRNEDTRIAVDERRSRIIYSRTSGRAGILACRESLLEIGIVLDVR